MAEHYARKILDGAENGHPVVCRNATAVVTIEDGDVLAIGNARVVAGS